MVGLLTTPGRIALSRNNMIFSFQSSDEFGTPYGIVGAKSTIAITGTLDTGDILGIAYTDEFGIITTTTFTVVATPILQNHLPSYSGGSVTDYYNSVITIIAAHPNVQGIMNIDYEFGSSNNLIATAIDSNIDISLIWTYSPGGSSTTAIITTAPAQGATSPSGYEIIVELFLEDVYDSGNFTKKATISSSHDEQGQVLFNVMDIIDDEIRKTFEVPPIPNYDQVNPFIANNLRRYKIRYRENYTGNTTPDPGSFDTIRKVICGGVSQNLFADYDYINNVSATNSILSWAPNNKTLSPLQKEWMGWYNYTNTTTYVLAEVVSTHEDGTTSTFYKYYPAISVKADETALFPVGPTELGIASDVQYYSVRFLKAEIDNPYSPTTYFSPERTFYIDYSYYEEVRYIMYLNGFCLPETIRCIGNHSTDLEVSRETSNHVLSPDYDKLHSETRQHSQSFINYFTYRTGYITAAEAHALQEWLIYNDGYEIYQEGYIPLDIKDRKFDIVETKRTLNSYSIQARPRMNAKNYSNINIPLSVEQTGWQIEGDEFWKTVYGNNWQLA